MDNNTSSLAIVQKQLSETSGTLIRLLNLLKPLDISTIDCLENLDVELGTFANALIMLAFHMNNTHPTALDEGEWESLQLHLLLANADRCISRLETIVTNGLRRGGSLKKYVRDTTAEAEIRHLRIRLEIYNMALGAPVMLFVVQKSQNKLNPGLSTLGFDSVSGWLNELSHKCMRLNNDTRIPRIVPPSALQQERRELSEVVMGIIFWMRNQLPGNPSVHNPGPSTPGDTPSASTTPFKPGQPQPQLRGGTFGPTAAFSDHETPISPPTAYPYPTTTPGGYSTDDIARIAHSMNGLPLPLPPSFTSSSSSSPASSLDANQPQLEPPPTSLYHPQIYRILEFPTLHLNPHLHTQYELARTLLLATPPTYGAGVAISNYPAQLIDRTRALNILSELHKTSDIEERDKFALAHLLAQMYMSGGRDIEDLELAKEYCLEAINGRHDTFGLEDPDTQASIVLLSVLAAKMGQERRQGEESTGIGGVLPRS